MPTAVYGAVMVCAGISYTILQGAIIRCQGPRSKLAALVKRDIKGKLSITMYAAAPGVSVTPAHRRRSPAPGR